DPRTAPGIPVLRAPPELLLRREEFIVADEAAGIGAARQMKSRRGLEQASHEMQIADKGVCQIKGRLASSLQRVLPPTRFPEFGPVDGIQNAYDDPARRRQTLGEGVKEGAQVAYGVQDG